MLIDDWYPVTHDMGLIESPVEQAVSTFIEWQQSFGAKHRSTTASSLDDALQKLAPLSAEKRRCAFVPTRSTWTAFFASGIDGSDPFPNMSELSRRLCAHGMRVCSSPPESTYPGTIWEVYAPEALGGVPPLGYMRSIVAANDGGRWIFEQSGPPFPFEDVSRYSRPRKRDRFDRAALIEYLAHFGLNPFRDELYVPSAARPAIVLERISRWQNPPSEFSLAQVVAGEPWKKA